jgi:hypothetical protein
MGPKKNNGKRKIRNLQKKFKNLAYLIIFHVLPVHLPDTKTAIGNHQINSVGGKFYRPTDKLEILRDVDVPPIFFGLVFVAPQNLEIIFARELGVPIEVGSFFPDSYAEAI